MSNFCALALHPLDILLLKLPLPSLFCHSPWHARAQSHLDRTAGFSDSENSLTKTDAKSFSVYKAQFCYCAPRPGCSGYAIRVIGHSVISGCPGCCALGKGKVGAVDSSVPAQRSAQTPRIPVRHQDHCRLAVAKSCLHFTLVR